MPDRVFLKGARFQARIGVTEEERSEPQELILDLSWPLDIQAAAANDELSDTICYFQVWTHIARFFEKNSFKLIEALAEALIAELFGAFPMTELSLTVKKPGALAAQGVDYAGLEITRTRPR